MHTLLQAAHRAAPEATRPSPPCHGGVDANPQLGSFGMAGVAIFVAEALDAQVLDNQRVLYDRRLGHARDVYERHARAEGKEVKRGTKTRLCVLSKEALAVLRREITLPNKLVGVQSGLSVAPTAASCAAFAAYDLEMQAGGPEVTAALRSMIGRVVPVLPVDGVEMFLRDLDRRLLREELRAVLAQRRDPRCARVVACLWRAAAGRARAGRASGAQVSHWIGSFDDGSYLLVYKVGSRWQIFVGSRDDVLATVPDGQMESAVNAILSQRR